MKMPDFAYRLKQIRIAKRVTQKELADYLSVSQNAVFNWENGKREPSIDTISKIADYFQVHPSYLTGWSENELTAKVSSWGIDAIIAHSKEEKELLNNCRKLNQTGQTKAVEQVELLTKIPEYQKEPKGIDQGS